MLFKPKLSWFATEKGRKWSYYGACTTGIGLFCINYIPHTFLLEQFKDIVQMYRGGEGVPVPAKVMTRVDQVLNKMKIPEKERKYLKFFTVYGFDPFFAGSTNFISGAYIGIPSNYSYEKIRDVERNLIAVKGEPVTTWNTKAGEDMLNALVLSEDAQKFAIATQIHQARTNHALINSTAAITCFIGAYTFSHAANKKFNGFSRPLAFRCILYCFIGTFMGGIWALTKDLTTAGYEETADKEVAELSPELAKGGLEFYEKTLLRNAALREMLGKEGESKFAASGNPQVLLRTDHLPITYRRDKLQAIVNKFSEQEQRPETSVPAKS